MDLIPLGLQFSTEGLDTTNRGLDQLVAKSGQAEKATDALATSSKRVSTATGQMMASLTQAVQAVERSSGAHLELVRSQIAAAEAARREEEALRKAAEAARRKAAEAADLARRLATVKTTIDPLATAIDRVNDELRDAAMFYKQGAISAEQYAKAQSVLGARLNTLQIAHAKGAAGARLQSHEMLNLSRQFADIGVTAAMGMNPLMIMVQQGPQIAETFALASARGLTFSAVLRQVAASAWAAVAPFAPFVAAATGVAAVLGGGLALATRAINKEAGDLASTLGLTEEQLKKVEDRGVTMGDTLKATFQVLGGYIWDAIGPTMQRIGSAISDALDNIGSAMKTASGAVLGAWIGAYRGVQAAWAMLPHVLGDVTVTAANGVIKAVEALINRVIDRINVLAKFANDVNGRLGLPKVFTELSRVDLTEFENKHAGAARAAGQMIGAQVKAGYADGIGLADRTFERIAEQAMKNATNRIRQEAGPAKKAAEKAAKEIREAFNAGGILGPDETRLNLRPRQTIKLDPKIDIPRLEEQLKGLSWDRLIRLPKQLMADDIRSAFADGITAALSGDLKNFLQYTFQNVLHSALSKALQSAVKVDPTGAVSIGAGTGLSAAAVVGGSIIGGPLGGALSGAGAGAMIAGPIGAAIGGLIGGIGGLLSSSKKAKRALEEQRKAQEDLNRAATQQGFDLWIEVLELMGHATSAQTVRRDQMLAGIDPRNQEMARRMFALEDARALEDMQIRLFEAQGRAAEAMALRHKQEMDATTDALKPMLALIHAEEVLALTRQNAVEAARSMTEHWVTAYESAAGREAQARDRLMQAYRRDRQEIEATRDKFLGLADALRAAREGLDAQLRGPEASRAEFDRIAAQAALGDADSMSRMAGMVSEQVELVRATARTDLEAAAGIARIRDQISRAEGTATRQAGLAEQQLNRLDSQVAHLIRIDDGVGTVADNIALLAKAIAEANQLGTIKDPQWGAIQNVRVNQRLAEATGFTGRFGEGEWQRWIVQQTQAIRDIARHILMDAGQSDRIVGFANGGMFAGGLRLVGERGPEVEATGPARYWSAEDTAAMLSGGDNADVVAAIHALGERLDRIEINTGRAARGSLDAADMLRNASEDGTSFNVKTAA